MASTISNSNYYSVSASSNNGIAGLVSGMDTDSMVKQMLSGTQSKIDAKKQEKQQLEWKQEQYQEVITAINSFSSKYFDTSYDSKLSTNLANSAFFSSMVSSITSGSSLKLVSTATSAATGSHTINVTQLATAARLNSSEKMSGSQTITGNAIDTDAIKAKLQEGDDLTFDLTLDGVKKTITLSASDFKDSNGDFSADLVTAENINSALAEKTANAFGSYVTYNMSADNMISFGIGISDGAGGIENGHELTITGAGSTYLGITAGDSTLINGLTKLSELTGVTGDTFKFSINGTDFEFSGDTSVSKMMNTINSSDAGVRITYSSMTDSFSLEQTSTGAGFGINLAQNSGNLLTSIFGEGVVSASNKMQASMTLNKSSIDGDALADDYTTTEAAMDLTVNGKSYTFSLPAEDGVTYTKADVETKLNDWLKDTLGKDKNGDANISYAGGDLATKAGFAVSFTGTNDFATALGFAGKNNDVAADTDVSEIAGIGGFTVGFTDADGNPTTTFEDIAGIAGQPGLEVSYADGKFTLSGTAGTYSLAGTALESLFGSSVTVGSGAMTGSATAGKDAIVTIDGVATTRSSNTFAFDGITVTATDIGETKIGTSRDTEKIIEGIKSFVNDYNTLIEDLYGRVTQDADYRNYKPLTTEQEDEMTDKQIELWEKKAKTGLLRSDTDINTLIDSMRSAIYTSAKDSGLALYSIGIESETWNGAGKLTIDENMLRTAVESDPEGVSNLFTDKTSGVATVLSAACDKAAKISVASTGALVAKAGAKDWTAGAKNNDIYFDLQRINDRLDYLDDLYQNEKTRYWNQFSAMETIMQNYSSQSAMLTNMFA